MTWMVASATRSTLEITYAQAATIATVDGRSPAGSAAAGRLKMPGPTAVPITRPTAAHIEPGPLTANGAGRNKSAQM